MASHPPCPETEYGRQKAEAEERLLALGDKVMIVRLTKVLSKDTALLKQWTASLRANETIHPFSDMVLAPVSLGYLTDVLVRLIDLDRDGFIQVSGPEDMTYEALARYVAKLVGASQDLIHPLKSSESQIPIEWLPAHTTLDTSILEMAMDSPVPNVWSCLDQVIAELLT
jgi:dTDP-4-dehydrorhamnose reductase